LFLGVGGLDDLQLYVGIVEELGLASHHILFGGHELLAIDGKSGNER